MKKVLVLLSIFAFMSFVVAPTVMAFNNVIKVAVHDDPPKTDKKDGKCSTPCSHDKKCEASKCSHAKDGKSEKSCCKDKAKASCCKDKEKKAEEKTPVPDKK